jgi:hypothetical protein
VCEDGFGARAEASAAAAWGTAPCMPLLEAVWKGNSAPSLVDMGEPVGADRIILGPPFDGEGMCISSVSFEWKPSRSGDSTRRCSCLPSAVIGATARPLGETSVSGWSAMSPVELYVDGKGSRLLCKFQSRVSSVEGAGRRFVSLELDVLCHGSHRRLPRLLRLATSSTRYTDAGHDDGDSAHEIPDGLSRDRRKATYHADPYNSQTWSRRVVISHVLPQR